MPTLSPLPLTAAAAALTCTLAMPSFAASTAVIGGATSVALDFDTLAAAASLELSGVSPDVAAPGAIDGSVAFDITAPTTFAYDPADFLGTFSGTIEHSGSVFFNDDTVEVGDFSIGFDAARAGSLDGAASGFFVASTTGIAATLFDVANPDALEATETSLLIGAGLLVSPEFGSFLQTNGLSTANLAGAQVGSAQVNGVSAVPTPSAAAAGLVGVGGLLLRRRTV